MADPQSNAAPSAHPAVLTLPEGAPRSGVIHVRHRHVENYTIVGNHLAQHGELSAAAIGLAVYIQSLPDGVSVTGKALALRFREGERAIRRAMNELEEAGYLARPRVDLGRGKFATRTFAFDNPGAAPEPPRPDPEPDPDRHPDPRPDSAPDTDPDPDPDPDSDPDPGHAAAVATARQSKIAYRFLIRDAGRSRGRGGASCEAVPTYRPGTSA